MRMFSIDILGNEEIDLGGILHKRLDGYSLIRRGNTSILASDITKIRTGTTMLNVLILTTNDQLNFKLDFIAGGGKMGLIIQMDWWSESSEISNMIEAIEEICEKNNLTMLKPGEQYY